VVIYQSDVFEVSIGGFHVAWHLLLNTRLDDISRQTQARQEEPFRHLREAVVG
jgi:hypothetical protein